MCGIAEVLGPDPATPDLVRRMAAVSAHGGPDGQTLWIDADGAITLGHRRVSILDRSPHGHQPMHSPCFRFVVSYNGELYTVLWARPEILQEKEFGRLVTCGDSVALANAIINTLRKLRESPR